jgi:phosphoserine phosphatase RsbU/P
MAENHSIGRLEVTRFKLNTLLEITQAINENRSQESLVSRYEVILREELNIGKLMLFKFADEWELILSSGFGKKPFNDIEVERDLLQYEDISFVSSDRESPIKDFDIVIPVIRDNRPLAYVLIGDIDEETEGISPTIKHLHFIQTLSNVIVVAIENIRLNQENIRQAAIKKELELASKLQEMLIPDPRKLPTTGAMKVSAFYHPHMDVGGDYFDYIELSKDVYGFCICDVSGKGISAAFIMSNFQANLRALFNCDIPLETLVVKLNDRVNESTKGERFLTMFIGKYNVATRELSYINAGHNAPLVFNINTKSITRLESHCVGIGMLDEIPSIQARRIIIDKNVKLLCYTDGLVEILNEELVENGTESIEPFIKNSSSIDRNIDDIVNHYGILTGNQAIFDDITILGIEFD